MRTLARVLFTATMATVLVGALAIAATAGPPGPPAFGPSDGSTMETANDACPWPDFLNGVLWQAGARKCLPTAIPWSVDGVRIVTDPLVGTGGAQGWITFWCQSRVGLHYIVTAVGLAPNTSYPVTATELGTLGTLHTDANGNGVVGGQVPLDPGGYEVLVSVGSVLTSPAGDDVGFEVF